MTTRTRSRPASAGRFQSPTARRSPSSPPRRKPASAGRATPRFGRPQPKQSALQKMAGTIGGLFGGGRSKASKRHTPSAKQGVGMAAIAGVAGLAMKNRDKLGKLIGRGGDEHPADRFSPAEVTSPGAPPTPPHPGPLGERP
ncbi:hypothetical protein [Capillimicrobium parvum]|uniref:Uncharacterized protein n=1 Tax=Capillimicrobium parvum TaxID=2884022 RepID=A0A9E6XXP0_9ACTN|nr:hypothetical protein [Capillimicrobium parvum]UGS35662.1 hypothetical protein DSM104329_02057 [Capillimicrobium parvum]